MIRIARREMLAASAAAALLPPVARAQAQSSADTAFLAKLDDYTGQLLRFLPETATEKGLDHGEQAGLRGQLQRIGPADIAAGNKAVRAVHDGVAAIDGKALSSAMQLRRDAVLFSTSVALEGTGFGYGGGAMVGLGGSAQPYVVSQQNGAINEVPELLSSSHPISNSADAEAYVARVVDLARLLDEETEAMLEHAAIGVTPPKFIADNALGILRDFRATPAAQQSIITNLAHKTQAIGLSGHDAAAVRALDALVYPALDRQIAAMAKTTANAPMTAGVSRLPDGEAFYRWALKMGTSTSRTPQEIHRIGLEQNAAIKARVDAVLKANGLTQGTVGARMDALGRDPRNLYPDTDEGRAQILAYLEQGIARVRAIMPKLSHMTLKADVMVKRVPPSIQDGAALGYMQPAPLDGSRPAIYYINLKSTAMWPRHLLNTLTAHEGIPGHTWQLAWVAEHREQAPAIGSLMDINAFVEGWALYAEQLVDEAGLYDNDPWSRLGYLQDQQLRACRLVVDTGMHAMGWSRAQAIDFFCTEMGKDRASSTSEIDRYCASPGQACGYKMGHNEILRLRDKARKALGKRFDLAAFNDVVVSSGGVPLGLLEGLIDRWLAAA